MILLPIYISVSQKVQKLCNNINETEKLSSKDILELLEKSMNDLNEDFSNLKKLILK